MANYLICATQRCGSTLLTELLARTGVAGAPNEYLLLWEQHAAKNDAVFWRLAVQHTLKLGRTDNGEWGAKVMANYFPGCMKQLRCAPEVKDLDDWGVSQRAFESPRIIRIRRRDRVRQAVSRYIALQTSVYHIASEGAGDGDNAFLGGELQHKDKGYNQDVVFDFDRVDAHVRNIADEEAYWDRVLAASTQPIHEVLYEDFAKDKENTLLGVLDFLEIQPPADLNVEDQMARMSNEVNERFRLLYEQEARLGRRPFGLHD